MPNLFWRLLAKLLARPTVANWIIIRAQRTPYLHILSHDESETYMGRWWLFNPYSRGDHAPKYSWWPWSVRVHHIMRADADRDLHDHPWNARTIILRGWYHEERLLSKDDPLHIEMPAPEGSEWTEFLSRKPGDTARLSHGEYHRIDRVSPDGVYTLFFTGPWQGMWGFLVNGLKVPWREYLGLDENEDLKQPEKAA
jgi:hypothetical protein